jgi:hypothetical protein
MKQTHTSTTDERTLSMNKSQTEELGESSFALRKVLLSAYEGILSFSVLPNPQQL